MKLHGRIVPDLILYQAGHTYNRRHDIEPHQNAQGTKFPFNIFMQVTASIFKAYDIRGTFPRTLTEDLAEALGQAFGTLAKKEN